MPLSLSPSGITFNDNSVQTAAATGFGFKNRIINGDMRIDQRNNGASQSVSGFGYTLDRWFITTAGGAVTSQRVGSGGAFSLQVTGASGVSGVGIYQRIEANNVADTAGQSVTVSFTASSSILTSIGVNCQTPTALDNWTSGNTAVPIATTTISATPTRFSYTFTMPSSATNGVQLYFNTGAFTSGTLTITGVQLEKGPSATAFDYRPYGTELQLCQRYFSMSYDIGTPPATATTVGLCYVGTAIQGFNSGGGSTKFIERMRTAPTVTIYDGAGTSGKMSYMNNNTTTFTNGITPFGIGNIGTLGFASAGQGSQGNVTNFLHYTASAEL